jgi:putative acetyltransferase
VISPNQEPTAQNQSPRSNAGAEAVGCVALIPTGPGLFEISKMAVSPQLRVQGIGRRLLEHAIAHARTLGATALFLGSSTKLPAAVHLYESVGFSHVPPEQLPPNNYTRTDVFTRITL